MIHTAKDKTGHFTTLKYCHTFAHPKVFINQLELSNELLYMDFPPGASKWLKDKVLDL